MGRTATVGDTSFTESTGRVVVALTGELDLATAACLGRLAGVSARQEVRQLILDLARLEFCDVVGLRALLTLQATLARHGVKLALTNVPGPTIRVMAVTGLDLYFTITPPAQSLPWDTGPFRAAGADRSPGGVPCRKERSGDGSLSDGTRFRVGS